MPAESPKIFISYSRADFAFVRELVLRLRADGLETWFDVLEMPPGKDYLAEIEAAIGGCSHCLVVVSRYSMRSTEVQREIEIAARLGRKLLTVILQTAVLPETIRAIHWVDFRRDFEGPLERLLAQLHGQPGGADESYALAHAPLRMEPPTWLKPGPCPTMVSALGVVYFPVIVAVQLVPVTIYFRQKLTVMLLAYLLAAVVFAAVSLGLERRRLTREVMLFLPLALLTLPLLTIPIYALNLTDQYALLTVTNVLSVALVITALVTTLKSKSIRRWLVAYPDGAQ